MEDTPNMGSFLQGDQATSARNSKLQKTQNTINARWLFGGVKLHRHRKMQFDRPK